MAQSISLIQPNFQTGPTHLNIYYLPYSVGTIWSYADSITEINNNYRINQIIWKRDPIELLAKKLSNDAVVVFSTYVWNRNYNYALAKRIKEINSKVVTIFGGPEPAITDPLIFQHHPYIDFVIKKEGEKIFSDLLLGLLHNTEKQISGLLINHAGQLIDTGNSDRINDLSILPSPYVSGFFDQLVHDNPDVSWTATLETNRGCPYQCTFCDWGSLTYTKVKQFPLERVFAELEWMSANCDGIWCADANFGMFIERDSAIVDKLIQLTQAPTNRIGYWFSNWAKNQKTHVIDMIEKLSTQTTLIGNGLTVSTQTMTPRVLDVIKRKNLGQHKLREIFDLAHKKNIFTYTELILGLPGETKQSFMDGVYEVMEYGNHHGIDIFHCQLLENAELNQVQKTIYDIKTIEWLEYISPVQHIDSTELVPSPIETVSVVVATDSMPKHDLLEVMTWVGFMNLFHFYGFGTQISRFLRLYNNITYKEFYQLLYSEFLTDPYFIELIQQFTDQCKSLLDNGRILRPMIDIVPFNAINYSSGFIMSVHIQQKTQYLFNWLDTFLSRHYDLDQNLRIDLIKYQQQLTLTYDKILDQHTVPCQFTHDIHGFINNSTELHQPTCLKFNLRSFQKNSTMSHFLENCYFRKKQRYGLLEVERIKK
jgi:radical SAM superfamily enzyme YgiQ (UPF0313 family)